MSNNIASTKKDAPPSPASVRVLTGDNKQQEDPLSPDTTSTTTPAMATLVRYLHDQDWSFVRQNHLVLSHLHGENGSFRVVVEVREEVDPDQRILLVFVFAPVKVPPEHRLVVAEYTIRANWAITLGHLEMDFADGEFRGKGCLDYTDGELTTGMVEAMIHKTAAAMDRCFPGLMRIIYGGEDAVTAIQPIIPQPASAGMAYALAQVVEGMAVDGNDETALRPAHSVVGR